MCLVYSFDYDSGVAKGTAGGCGQIEQAHVYSDESPQRESYLELMGMEEAMGHDWRFLVSRAAQVISCRSMS